LLHLRGGISSFVKVTDDVYQAKITKPSTIIVIKHHAHSLTATCTLTCSIPYSFLPLACPDPQGELGQLMFSSPF